MRQDVVALHSMHMIWSLLTIMRATLHATAGAPDLNFRLNDSKYCNQSYAARQNSYVAFQFLRCCLRLS